MAWSRLALSAALEKPLIVPLSMAALRWVPMRFTENAPPTPVLPEPVTWPESEAINIPWPWAASSTRALPLPLVRREPPEIVTLSLPSMLLTTTEPPTPAVLPPTALTPTPQIWPSSPDDSFAEPVSSTSLSLSDAWRVASMRLMAMAEPTPVLLPLAARLKASEPISAPCPAWLVRMTRSSAPTRALRSRAWVESAMRLKVSAPPTATLPEVTAAEIAALMMRLCCAASRVRSPPSW